MEKQPIQLKTISESVYQQIRKQIFEKKLLSGQRLPEVSIAKELEVSRTPVREALRRLAGEGLVQIIPNWGAAIVSPTEQEISDTCKVRKNLEAMAIAKAAGKITPVQLRRLQECIDLGHKTSANQDLEAYLSVNDDFHMIIAESSGNATLTGFVKNILSRASIQILFGESSAAINAEPSLDEHSEILKALGERDESLCISLIEKHIDKSMASLKMRKQITRAKAFGTLK